MDETYHRWPEVYLPNYGWIPVDPTFSDIKGDKATRRDHAYAIGYIGNVYLITTQSGGGSTTLEWNYNRNENYITEPKTNLNINQYADWEIINNKTIKQTPMKKLGFLFLALFIFSLNSISYAQISSKKIEKSLDS